MIGSHRKSALGPVVLSVALGGLTLLRQAARARRRRAFAGKTVLITGGARGLGLALARRFAAEGARLILVSRTSSELERARQDLEARGADVRTFAADLRVPDRIDELVSEVTRAAGRIDVLVNTRASFRACRLKKRPSRIFESRSTFTSGRPSI